MVQLFLEGTVRMVLLIQLRLSALLFFLCIQRLSSFHRCQAVVNAWNGNMVELLIKDVSLISEEYPSFRV